MHTSRGSIRPFSQSTKRLYKLITPSELKSLDLNLNSYKILDSTWFMPNSGKTGLQEYKKEHIPNSIYVDIDKVCDQGNKLPHMLPNLKTFNEEISKLQLSRDDNLIIYDKQGIFANCRTAWMFEVFGHDLNKIFILNSYPLYKEENGEVVKSEAEESQLEPTTTETAGKKHKYEAIGLNRSKVIAYDDLLKLLESKEIKDYYLLDARSPARFLGTLPEPREGLSSGHIPGAINVPFTELLTGPSKSIPSKEVLREYFAAKDINDDKPIIIMCGTGVTACVVKACLDHAELNKSGHIIYDGSWTEWLLRLPSKYIVKDE